MKIIILFNINNLYFWIAYIIFSFKHYYHPHLYTIRIVTIMQLDILSIHLIILINNFYMVE